MGLDYAAAVRGPAQIVAAVSGAIGLGGIAVASGTSGLGAWLAWRRVRDDPRPPRVWVPFAVTTAAGLLAELVALAYGLFVIGPDF